MSEQLVFNTIGNAGMSFTDLTNENIVKMYTYTTQQKDAEPISYKNFQAKINDNCGVTESNVRMYSPFFYSLGLANDYSTDFYINQYFSDIGKAYAKSLILCKDLENDDIAYRKAKEISKNILSLSLINKRKSSSKDYYFDFLKLCLTYGYTNLCEFNLMLYHKEVLKELNYIEIIENPIFKIRSGEYEFVFLQDRKTKDGQQVREKFPDNTFNYTRNLLTECGLIRIENNNYYIQESQIRFVDAIVKGELS